MAEVRVGVFRVLGMLSLEEQEELDRTSDKNALVYAAGCGPAMAGRLGEERTQR